ncbi:hypothetical protein MFU01_78410 [Myxococcus fulvus]|uniref:Uncharacterized protein n=1 Tax=Myxococcus fulvus TaxID=33 RepID=A0A511TF57_MYXFU|nr:hypothetical protein MFU01_78410 [Myxococcus fulvus]
MPSKDQYASAFSPPNVICRRSASRTSSGNAGTCDAVVSEPGAVVLEGVAHDVSANKDRSERFMGRDHVKGRAHTQRSALVS